MVIRKITDNDMDQLAEIWKDFMDFHQAMNPFFTRRPDGHENFTTFALSLLEKEDFLLIGAFDGEIMAGYALAQEACYPPVFLMDKYCMLTDIALAEKYRGQGVGKKLIETVKDWAREKGLNRMELRVAHENTNARGFYEKMGFKDYLHQLSLDI